MTTLRAPAALAGSRPAHPPTAAFAAVMGMASVGLAWRFAALSLGAPALIGETILGLATLVFVVLAGLFLRKVLLASDLVRKEYADAASSSYFGTIVIAVSLLAYAAIPYSRTLGTVLWAIAAISGAGLMLALLANWIVDDVKIAQITPLWFIPVVGNATTAYAASALGYHEIGIASFAFAVLCWLTIQPLVFYRLNFAEPLPARAAPSLALLVSSPAVLATAWYDLTGGGGIVFSILVFKALFLAALVVRLRKMARGIGFSVSAWAYTFPAGALAGALLRYHVAVPGTATAILAVLGLALATAIVAYVAARSTVDLLRPARA